MSDARILLLVGAPGAGCSSSSRAPASGGVDAGEEGGGPPAPAAVAGTVTLPADATGRCAMVSLDDDTTGSNGSYATGLAPPSTANVTLPGAAITRYDFQLGVFP